MVVFSIAGGSDRKYGLEGSVWVVALMMVRRLIGEEWERVSEEIYG